MMENTEPTLEQMASGINVLDIEKIGNLINYLSRKIDHLYATKLLKLLYIIDEQSVRESGSPVTWLNYDVWEMGPVAADVHKNITFCKADAFEGYFYVIQNKGKTRIKHLSEFDDSEFSDFEMELIDSVISTHKFTSANELISLLHEPDTLWTQVVKERGLQELFDTGETKTSPYQIDLSKATTDTHKINYYKHALEEKKFYDSLK